jgi:hypothetical protein
MGIGIFEKHPDGGNIELGYKYYIYDSGDSELFKSEVFKEQVTPPPRE